MNKFFLSKEGLEDKDIYLEVAYEFAEHIDETTCNLRDIVAEIVSEMLWIKMHPNDKDGDFYKKVSDTLHRYEKFEFRVIDWDEDDEDDKNLTKIEI